MTYDVLAMMAVVLTLAMFVTRNALLGFPSAIMWAILGGYAYTQSAAAWDIDYILFFACAFGMTIFSIFAAFALRERRDTIADKELEEGEGEFIDEDKEEESLEGPEVSTRTKRLHERAKKRRKAAKKMES